MFRFTGLPNNCNLEMSEIVKKRTEQDLEVCVQLEDGTRLNGSFPSSSTLREVVTKMCPEKLSTDQSPVVVIYMRSKLYGEALDSTSLKSLGKFYETVQLKKVIMLVIQGLTSGGRALIRVVNATPESLKVQANVSAPLPQKLKEEPLVETKPKFRGGDPPGPSPVFQFKVNQLKRNSGEIEEEPVRTFNDSQPMEIEETPVETSTQPEVEVQPVPVEQTMDDEPEPIINILDDRGTIIFSLDSTQSRKEDQPDNFFDLTEAEVQKLHRELKREVEAFENKPLMSEQHRKLEENKKILSQLSAYKKCAIRIQMEDRYVIQTTFSSVDTIRAVMDFLKQFLVDPEMDFHLCKNFEVFLGCIKTFMNCLFSRYATEENFGENSNPN